MREGIGEEVTTWRRWQEIPAVCLHPHNLRSTLVVAAVVGTSLFVINQLDLVLSGEVGPRIWVKAALTYLVPLVVGNYGLLVGTHKKGTTGDRDGEPGI